MFNLWQKLHILIGFGAFTCHDKNTLALAICDSWCFYAPQVHYYIRFSFLSVFLLILTNFVICWFFDKTLEFCTAGGAYFFWIRVVLNLFLLVKKARASVQWLFVYELRISMCTNTIIYIRIKIIENVRNTCVFPAGNKRCLRWNNFNLFTHCEYNENSTLDGRHIAHSDWYHIQYCENN